MIETKRVTPAIRRRREIEFLSRELIQHARDLMTAVVGLVPNELAASSVDLTEGTPMRCVADRLDETRLCFELLREELSAH